MRHYIDPGAAEPRGPGGQFTPNFFRCGVHIWMWTPHFLWGLVGAWILLTTHLSCQTSGCVIQNAIKTRWDVFAVVRLKSSREYAYTMIIMVLVADLIHENLKSTRVMRWWLCRLWSRFGAKSSRERKHKWLPGLSPHCQCWIENLSDSLSLQYKENKGKFVASNGRLKAKSFSASGGFAPWPGALPLEPAGAPPPDPRYRLTLAKSALFDPPLFFTFRGLCIDLYSRSWSIRIPTQRRKY